MSSIMNVPPGGISGGPTNMQPLAVLQAQAASGTSPTSRLLLPTAVTANTVVPAYSDAPKQPVKPTVRQVSTQPSSPFAAQYITQSPDLTPDELAVFARRDLPQPGSTNVQQAPAFTPPPPAAAASTAQAATLATTATATAQGTPVATAAIKLPTNETVSPVTTPPKKVHATLSRGTSAYEQTTHAPKTQFTNYAVLAVG